MKRLPSASKRCGPNARSMKSGVFATAFHARTGEFTAPGITRDAREKKVEDFSEEIIRESVLNKIFFFSHLTICAENLDLGRFAKNSRSRAMALEAHARDRKIFAIFVDPRRSKISRAIFVSNRTLTTTPPRLLVIIA